MRRSVHNVSQFAVDETARTRLTCAWQRAKRLSQFSPNRVIELCVGPSLKTLEAAYAAHGLECHGNDIDKRWYDVHRTGKWLFGDAMELARMGSLSRFDVVVFAPPLTHGCSGERCDALRLYDVTPGYIEFVDAVLATPISLRPKMLTLVLHGRVWSTPADRSDYHRLMSELWARGVSPRSVALVDGCRKYVDVDVALGHPSGWYTAV